MVLYDGNYNFLGMSERLLNKLGFDDLNEFSSYYKDFADLFEKENGLIYKFQNFSWIDFILYGGANKDTAIIKDKSNNRIKVKLNINEILLKEDIKGTEKFYSVVLEDEELLSTQEETQINMINNEKAINITSMLIDESNINNEQKESAIPKMVVEEKQESKPNEDLSINLSFLNQESMKEDEDVTVPNSSISLDFLNQDNAQDKEVANLDIKQPNEITTTIDLENKIENKHEEKGDEDVVLNFFKSNIEDNNTIKRIDSNEDINQVEDTFIMPKTDKVKIEENIIQETKIPELDDEKLDLNFLKIDEKTINSSNKEQEIKEQEPKEEKFEINLDALNSFKKEKNIEEDNQKISLDNIVFQNRQEEGEAEIKLDFLQTGEEKPQASIQVEQNNRKQIEREEALINLNFLQDGDSTKSKQSGQIKEDIAIGNTNKDMPEINLNFLKINEEKDLMETDTNITPNQNISLQSSKKVEENSNKISEEEIDLGFLKGNNEKTIQATKEYNLDAIKSVHIENDGEQIVKSDNKLDIDIQSFVEPKVEPQKDKKERVKNKAKKKEIEIKILDTNLQQKQSTILSNEEIHKTKEENIVKKEDKFEFLENLNISIEDKKEILRDFLSDAKHSLKLVRAFFAEQDYESIKFIIIKVQSSAQILELTKLIDILDDLNFYIKKRNNENIKNSIDDFKNELKKLEKFL